MEVFKKPYEISLWEDKLVWHRRKLVAVKVQEKEYVPGKYYSLHTEAQGAIPYILNNKAYDAETQYYTLADMSSGNYLEGDSVEDIYVGSATSSGWFEDGELVPQTIISYYKETRLCTIGSNTMASLSRCVNPKLTRKVNGEEILQFTMYYQYIDFETGEKVYNPFNKYMVNERKIKLRLGEPGKKAKWYDFVIKQIQEDSESKAFTYTCKSQVINELSKTGFDLVLDNELENNMGTIEQLASTILEGSDWSVGECENLKQFIEEPLYKIKVVSGFHAQDMETKTSITILPNDYIYAFYSHINDQNPSLQFLYNKNKDFDRDDKLVIDKEKYHNYILYNTQYRESGWPEFAYDSNGNANASFSMDYRGMRLVRQTQTKYDSTIDKYVQVYKKKGSDDTYYGFTESEYISSANVTNYISNPSGFITTTGWQASQNATLEVVTLPELTAENFEGEFTSYLHFNCSKLQQLLNHSVSGFRSSIKGFQIGEEYVLRLKYKYELNGDDITRPLENIYLAEYEVENNRFVPKKTIFTFCKNWNGETLTPGDDTIWFFAKCENTVTENEFKDVTKRYGLIFEVFGYADVYIEEVQLFPRTRYTNLEGEEVDAAPGGEIFSETRTKYIYYKPNSEWSSIKDLITTDEGYQPNEDYSIQYNSGADAYTKVRSITASESNRFNLLQDLNEAFECWARFDVQHNQDTGEILLGKDVGKIEGDEAFRQQKFVSFHEYVGRKNPVGFKYGINSKSIKRTIDSENIVTKMIVKDNANEFAPNGFCTIARAEENPTKENFLISFDHYIQQKLLDLNNVTNDLYLDVNGYIGYYKHLKRLNKDRDSKIDLQANLLVDISKYSSDHQTYKVSYDSAIDERNLIESNIINLIVPEEFRNTVTFEEAITNTSWTSQWEKDLTFQSYKAKWARCKTIERQHKPLYEMAKSNLDAAEAQYKEIAEELEIITKEKRALNLQFYKKYSRFIQEGSWIDENYVDNNLYYLDACSTLHTSAQPMITYDISVIDLSCLPEYEGYEFDLGDITYIEDTEFFGWSLIDGITPYKEEIVVSEIIQELDAPEKNIIKVQNYKTQFEDLFQRITASTQALEFHEGEYQRASSVIQPNGTIAASTLANSMANNSFVLSNAKDQSVIIDESGLTTTSLVNPSEMVRLVSGGIFLSTDNGQTWRTGITASGINTSLLTAGQINADEINIMSGGQPAFRWDAKGLNAYYKDEEGKGYNLNKYVRFNQYGLYGANNSENEINSLEDIHKYADFALTWEKFLLRSKHGNGYVSIDSDKHFVVCETIVDENNIERDINRIQIGNLGTKDNPEYGIVIRNGFGNDVFKTTQDGLLRITDEIYIGDVGKSTVRIGNLDVARDGVDALGAPIKIQEVFHAGDTAKFGKDSQFIIYEDGTMIAKAGQIGGVTIGDFDSLKKLDIEANLGYNFKIKAGICSPEVLTFEVKAKGFVFQKMTQDGILVDNVVWQGSADLSSWTPIGIGPRYEFSYERFLEIKPKDGTYYIKATAISTEGKTYETWFRVVEISDVITLAIESTNGVIFRNGQGSTSLTAKLFQNGVEIDTDGTEYEYIWTSPGYPDFQHPGKVLQNITAGDIEFKKTYVCEVRYRLKGGNNGI